MLDEWELCFSFSANFIKTTIITIFVRNKGMLNREASSYLGKDQINLDNPCMFMEIR